MPAEALGLSLAAGWRRVDPRPIPFLLVTDNETLRCTHTDFKREKTFEHVHHDGRRLSDSANTPIAVDDERGRIYVSKTEFDESKNPRTPLKVVSGSIFEADMRTGALRELCRVPEKMFTWMLFFDPHRRALIALLHPLVSNGTPAEIVSIDVGTGVVTPVEGFPRPGFPADVSVPLRRMLFYSPIMITDFDGAVLAKWRANALAGPGAFHPRNGLVILSRQGESLHERKVTLWNPEKNNDVDLVSGEAPAWSHCGEKVWYRETNADLWRYELKSGDRTRILFFEDGAAPQHRKSHSPPSAVSVAPDGRYLLAPVSARRVRDAEALEKELRFYAQIDHHVERADLETELASFLCVLDLEEREVWMHPGYAYHFAWMSARWLPS